MYPDHHQSLILVFFRPRAHERKLAPPVDARIGPEVDEYDFSVQLCGGQRLRIEPRRRVGERRQFASVAEPCFCRSAHPEFASRNRHGRGTQETTTAKIDLFDHRSLSIKDQPSPTITPYVKPVSLPHSSV